MEEKIKSLRETMLTCDEEIKGTKLFFKSLVWYDIFDKAAEELKEIDEDEYQKVLEEIRSK